MMPIDLRSDTVTRPTEAMRTAMASAPVGDDVFGDDPTVNRLQELAAAMLAKEAALFLPSGTQANLCGIMAHCGRGDEYIVGAEAHTYKMEAGGAAVLGSVQPQPLPAPRGVIDLDAVAAAVKPDDHHFARTRLLCLENTHNGMVVPLSYQNDARQLCAERGLRLHLDGARMFNAAVALGVEPAEVASPFDTVSFCLSKGLGAPVGSVLVGPAPVIDAAHKWRKMLGGGMRQAGILAAAGIHALERHVDRLAEDHDNATRLARGLNRLEWCAVDPESVETNMVFARMTKGDPEALRAHMAAHGVVIRAPGPVLRLVTHLDVSAGDIDHVLEVAAGFEP